MLLQSFFLLFRRYIFWLYIRGDLPIEWPYQRLLTVSEQHLIRQVSSVIVHGPVDPPLLLTDVRPEHVALLDIYRQTDYPPLRLKNVT